jgi:hypothetical protein
VLQRLLEPKNIISMSEQLRAGEITLEAFHKAKAAIPAADARRNAIARLAGRRIIELVREAFVNVIRTLGAIGGSTNAVVHLMAIARRAGIHLTLDDLDALGHGVLKSRDVRPRHRPVQAGRGHGDPPRQPAAGRDGGAARSPGSLDRRAAGAGPQWRTDHSGRAGTPPASPCRCGGSRRPACRLDPAAGRGYVKMCVDHVLQAKDGVDLDFLVGRSGTPVARDNH